MSEYRKHVGYRAPARSICSKVTGTPLLSGTGMFLMSVNADGEDRNINDVIRQ